MFHDASFNRPSISGRKLPGAPEMPRCEGWSCEGTAGYHEVAPGQALFDLPSTPEMNKSIFGAFQDYHQLTL